MSTDLDDIAERNWLSGLRTTLADEFEAQTRQLTQLTADTGDPAEAHMRAALIASTRQNLEQITGALRRIADGHYGSCDSCQRPIPRARLEVLPHARFCVPCQEKRNR